MARVPAALSDGRDGLARRRRCEPGRAAPRRRRVLLAGPARRGGRRRGHAGGAVRLPPAGARGRGALRPAAQAGRVRRLPAARRLRRQRGQGRARGGALLHLRQVPGHGAPRRLPQLRGDAPSARPGSSVPPAVGAPAAALGARRPGGQLLPGAHQAGQPHRRARGGHPARAQGRATAGDLPPQAPHHHLAQGRHSSARPARTSGQRRRHRCRA